MRGGEQLALEFPVPESAADPEALRRRVLEATRECVAAARERWPGLSLRAPRVRFDLRGQAAGEACADTGELRYNEDLLRRYGERFVAEIVPHEVAHLVVSARHPRARPHGGEWREVMRVFGAPARRCHAFETRPARRLKRFAYRCRCPGGHRLTARAHRRIRRGTAEYSCRECGRVLVWASA